MADPAPISAIRQMTGSRRPPPEIPPVTAVGALGKALARAGDATAGLVLRATGVAETRVTLSALDGQVDDHDLLAIAEGPDSRFGLLIADPDLIAAVIEMQTIGRVLPMPAPPRAATRTDAAMCADFFDQVLEVFETELTQANLPVAALCGGFRFAVQLDDYRAVSMTLPDIAYRRFQATLDLGAGSKQGTLSLLLPFDASLPQPPSEIGAEQQGDTDAPRVILTARVDLHAVLHRVRMSLDEVTGLAPGATLSLSRDALGAVDLEDMSGQVRATCRLGQAAGQRALRLGWRVPAPDQDAPASGGAARQDRADIPQSGQDRIDTDAT